MKKILLLLAAVGMIFTTCEAGGGLDDDNNDNNTEQPGGGNQGNEEGGDQGGEEIPADKTQAIKFQDENTKLLCTLHWDENEDGELSYEEASAVTDLGTAFKGSSILAFTELKYFTSLEKIADNAFESCVSLVKTTLPEQLTIIGTFAFNDCTNLKKIAIPNAVTEIGDCAFAGCTSLTSITTPNSVTKIGDYTFYYCTSLTSITIPDSVTSIGDCAFWNCSSLPVIDGIRYADTYLVEAVDKTRTSYTIRPGTRFIGDAFSGCTSLSSVTIPNSITSIGGSAFYGCTSLTNVTIPDVVTSIGSWAFAGCTSLTSITIPESVTEIGGFAFNSCSSLKEVYCKPTTPPTTFEYSWAWCAFDYNASGRKIYVPRNSVDAYKSASYWSNYKNGIYGYDF